MRNLLLDFDLIESENSCTQSIYCSLINWYQLEYELLFLYTWSFSFDENNNIPILGLRIGRKSDRIIEILNLFYSLTFKKIDTSQNFSKEIIENIYAQLLNNKPVILGTNLYWCPWSDKYKKELRYTNKCFYQNDCNYIIVIGIDFDKNIIYCKEKNTNNKLVCATFNDIINGCKNLILLENNGIIYNPIINWKEELKESLNYTKYNKISKDVFGNMRMLATYLISTEINILRERNGLSDLYLTDIPLLDRTMNIGRARKQFAKILRYFSLKFDVPQLIPIINDFYNVYERWNNIKIILLKGFRINKLNTKALSYIAEEIEDLSITEEKIFNNLYRLVD